MKKYALPLVVGLAAITVVIGRNEPKTHAGEMKTAKGQIVITPIGCIQKREAQAFIRLDAQHQGGLLGLADWSHIWVLYWFDRNDTPEQRAVLRVHPRGNAGNPLTGVFATRSPLRPNLIALSLCRVIAINGTDIEIEGIDALDHSPVINIKPYIPGLDRPQGTVNVPSWAGPPTNQQDAGANPTNQRP